MTPRAATEKTTPEMKEEAAVWRDSQPMKASCGICGKYYKGKTRDCLVWSRKHREEKHPEIVPLKRRLMRSPINPVRITQNKLDAEEVAEVEAARQKRAILHGVVLPPAGE